MFRLFITLIIVIFSHFVFADDDRIVYRAAMDTPKDLKAAGGFFPRGMDRTRPNQPPPDISLWNHVNGTGTGMARHDSGYVSTTVNRNLAIRWVSSYLNHNGYVYHIHTTPNFIDVNGTLGRYSPHSPEQEMAALGVIHWTQIIGWERVSGGTVGRFVRNPDYRERIYSGFSSGGTQPQLAGFPDNHQAWGQEPWSSYANCELKSTCTPKNSAQKFGEEWFLKSHKAVAKVMLQALHVGD
ncbi:enterotoxin A family protein [Bartonella sp. 1-1C]|uniref:enterotoxin A family protein n=1 Tax=Bartonella sp. 1-1C TaxID=515256 RepID=UPI0001F4CB18|nr:enterotoxin A family protein [Bartonella sp. 1-1C]ATO57321.1 Cholera toxin subunit A precursor [Bartonella sp. 1-1C]CBI80942.1 putative Heat-labile enterotoxin IIB, A chain [Bartonella sp. 1-1C]